MSIPGQQALDQFVKFHKAVRSLNPALEKSYPIVVAEQEIFWIFDYDRIEKHYQLVKQVPVTMQVPKKLRAAFQIQEYHNRIACVVTPEVFDKPEGFVTILHEFVHCYQYETCEQNLKAGLDIARKAQEIGDFMWEINHPFPYLAQDFIKPYSQFLCALTYQNPTEIHSSRRMLKAYLGVHDYEYMVWQEWKEGFARWTENLVKRDLGYPENFGGLQEPFTRVVFYAGGEALISYLAEIFPPIVADLTALFVRMLAI